MIAMMIGCVLSSFAADYNTKQEKLRTAIETTLKERGHSVERDKDGLKFMDGGDIYYVEIDEDSTNPMHVRLVKYIKFDSNFKRSEAMKKLMDYNSSLAVKAFCKEKNLGLASDMFVTSPEQFTNVFGDLLSRIKNVADKIKK